MNRFKSNLRYEDGFETIWRQRESHLDNVRGYRSFALLKGETFEGHPNLETFESVLERDEVYEDEISAGSENNQNIAHVNRMLSREEKDEIVGRINSDYSETVLTYVHYFAGMSDATAATLKNVTEEKMPISALVDGKPEDFEIPLVARVSNIKDAERVMVGMVFSWMAKLSEQQQ